ncbi:type II secretion system F family protein [bacterium]|nr:type II secretion system F family protein [bacterium]
MYFIFGGVILIVLYLLVAAFMPKKEDLLDERLSQLDSIIGDTTDGIASRERMNKSFNERIIRPLISGIGTIFTGKMKKSTKDDIQLMLLRAGNPGGISATEFLAIKTLFGVGLPVAAIGSVHLFTIIKNKSVLPAHYLLAAAAAAVIGILVPKLYLQTNIKKRKKAAQRQLPDVLDLLTVSIEAGLGFDMALQKVIEKMVGVLADEFKIVLVQIQLGKPRQDALKALADRMDVEELSSFIGALIQAEKLGVSLGRILRIQSDQMRIKRKQRAEEAAMKAPVKMMLPLVGCIFPVVLIVLMGGAAIKFFVAFGGGGIGK